MTCCRAGRDPVVAGADGLVTTEPRRTRRRFQIFIISSSQAISVIRPVASRGGKWSQKMQGRAAVRRYREGHKGLYDLPGTQSGADEPILKAALRREVS